MAGKPGQGIPGWIKGTLERAVSIVIYAEILGKAVCAALLPTPWAVKVMPLSVAARLLPASTRRRVIENLEAVFRGACTEAQEKEIAATLIDLALRSEACLLPAFVMPREGSPGFGIRVHPPLIPRTRDEQGVRECLEHCSRMLEALIRERPEQWWLWKDLKQFWKPIGASPESGRPISSQISSEQPDPSAQFQ